MREVLHECPVEQARSDEGVDVSDGEPNYECVRNDSDLVRCLGREKDLQVFTARGEGDRELDVLDETWEWWCAADEECDDGSPVRGVFG